MLRVAAGTAFEDGDRPAGRQVIDAMISRLDVLNTKVEDILRSRGRERPPSRMSISTRPAGCDRECARGGGGGCPEIIAPEHLAIVRAAPRDVAGDAAERVPQRVPVWVDGPIEVVVAAETAGAGLKSQTGVPVYRRRCRASVRSLSHDQEKRHRSSVLPSSDDSAA